MTFDVLSLTSDVGVCDRKTDFGQSNVGQSILGSCVCHGGPP